MGLLGAIGSGLAEVGNAGQKIGMEQMRAAIEEDRQARLLDVLGQKQQQTHAANATFDADLADQRKDSRAAKVRAMLTRSADQPNAQVAADAGLNDAASVGADENVGVDVQKHTRSDSMREMSLTAARGGQVDVAKDLAAADYYSGRNTLAAGRLAQGDRRLDLAEDLNIAKIENLDARTDLTGARAETVGSEPNLTKVQQARNSEIDAARKKIEGLDPEAIKAKTQKFSASGRENPGYDDQLASRVRLASKRKVGDDDWFDSQNATVQPDGASRADMATLASRFAADPAMKGSRMGKLTPKGREVLDAAGKLIGHYR